MFFEQSSKWKVVCLTKMHHISKNWEGIFDFQYKVAIGQYVSYGSFIFKIKNIFPIFGFFRSRTLLFQTVRLLNFADADFFMTPMDSTYQDKLICTLEYMVWPIRTCRNLPLEKTNNVSAKLFLC